MLLQKQQQKVIVLQIKLLLQKQQQKVAEVVANLIVLAISQYIQIPSEIKGILYIEIPPLN